MEDEEEQIWLPLRQAVVEVSTAYAEAMDCDRSEAIQPALEAMLRRMQYGICKTKAHKWVLTLFSEDEDGTDWHQDQTGTEIIPFPFWNAFQLADDVIFDDWVSGEYTFRSSSNDQMPASFGMAIDVLITRNGLPLIGGGGEDLTVLGAKAPANSAEQFVLQRRGARTKWNWENALCSIVAIANGDPDGLPEGYAAQSKIARMLGGWFSQHQGGEPVPSELAKRAGWILDAIESFRK